MNPPKTQLENQSCDGWLKPFWLVLIGAFSKCFIKLVLNKTGLCRQLYSDSLLSSLYHLHKKLSEHER